MSESCYLKEMPTDVLRKSDIIQWWQVRYLPICYHFFVQISRQQEHAQLYPTLARVTLDILPSQASSVPTEWLFSGGKVTVDDKRTHLGCEKFKEIELMKFSWRKGLDDLAGNNTNAIEEVELVPFRDHLHADEDADKWDVVDGGFIDYEELDVDMVVEECMEEL